MVSVGQELIAFFSGGSTLPEQIMTLAVWQIFAEKLAGYSRYIFHTLGCQDLELVQLYIVTNMNKAPKVAHVLFARLLAVQAITVRS